MHQLHFDILSRLEELVQLRAGGWGPFSDCRIARNEQGPA
jgi:hypothetical protein